jgi:hypothetical protein
MHLLECNAIVPALEGENALEEYGDSLPARNRRPRPRSQGGIDALERAS